jgi:hypothetical protein
MSARSIRRAAERATLKAARKAAICPAMNSVVASEEQTFEIPEPVAAPEPSARIAANRQNSLKSTGAKTAQGRAVSSLNALKTGLTGVTVLLPSEDAGPYQSHILSYEKQFKPVGPEECALTQSIADIRWRLNRIPALELALITIGHNELAARDENFNRPDLTPLLEMQIRRAFEKDFRNLHLQEARLARRREKEMAELRTLQAERKVEEEKGLAEGMRLYTNARYRKQPFDFASHGFEFSKERFISFLASQTLPIKYQELTAEPAESMPATA